MEEIDAEEGMRHPHHHGPPANFMQQFLDGWMQWNMDETPSKCQCIESISQCHLKQALDDE
jgi:hypothetical protein